MTSPASAPFPAFPRRPLELARGRAVLGPLIGWWLVGIAFIAIGLFMVRVYAPSLVREAPLRSRGVVTHEAELREGVCKTRKAILTECSGKLAFRTLPEHGQRVFTEKLDYMLFLRLDQDVDFHVRYDPARPEVHATSWGLHHFWNRVATLSVMVFFCIGMGPVFFMMGVTPLLRERAVRAGLRAPRPVAVRVSDFRATGKRLTIKVHFMRQGKPQQADQVMRKKEEPLLLGQTDLALALMAADGTPQVLDGTLADLKLSDAERADILRHAAAWPEAA